MCSLRSRSGGVGTADRGHSRRAGRARADRARAGPGAKPARGGLAMGAGGSGRTGGGHRPRRPLGRLARLAGRACRRPGGGRRRDPARGRPLPDRDNLTAGWSLPRPRRRPASAEALVAETASMSLASGKGQIAASVLERGPRDPKRPATPAAARRTGAGEPGSLPARDRGSPRRHAAGRFPAAAVCGWRMGCASSTSGGRRRESSPWSCMSMPAGSARTGRASRT